VGWQGVRADVQHAERADRQPEEQPAGDLNFGGDGHGGDIVIFSGTATVDPELPRADANRAYLSKYSEGIARIGLTPEAFAESYSEPVRIMLTGLRGH